jgi:hypothetical protein
MLTRLSFYFYGKKIFQLFQTFVNWKQSTENLVRNKIKVNNLLLKGMLLE